MIREIGDAAKVFAPGEFLREESAERGWTSGFVGRRLAIRADDLQGLVDGLRPLDEELAGKLAELLGTSADLWLQLERDYRRPAPVVDAGR